MQNYAQKEGLVDAKRLEKEELSLKNDCAAIQQLRKEKMA